MKFIVVDEMSNTREAIKQAISEVGNYEIVEASDGKEALSLIVNEHKKGAPINVIISDWNTPNMTGIQLLHKMKEIDIFRNIPFLMLTSKSEMENVKKAVSESVTGFIVKPFTTKQVQIEVRSIIGQIENKAA